MLSDKEKIQTFIRRNIERTGPLGFKNKSLTPYKGVYLAAQNIYKQDITKLDIDRPVYWEDEIALIKCGRFSKEQLALIHEFKKEWFTCRIAEKEKEIPFYDGPKEKRDDPPQAEDMQLQSTSIRSLPDWWSQQPKPKASAKGRKVVRRFSKR